MKFRLSFYETNLPNFGLSCVGFAKMGRELHSGGPFN